MTESTANAEQTAGDQAAQRIFRRGHSRVRRLRALRSLRPVPESLPDLQIVGPGSRFAARTHSPDRSGGPGPAAAGRFLRKAYRPVPGLPRVRDGVPLRRASTASWWKRRARRSSRITGGRFFRACRAISFSAACCRIRAASRFSRAFSTSTSAPGLQSLARASGILAPARACGPRTASAADRPRILSSRNWDARIPPWASGARAWRCSPAASRRSAFRRCTKRPFACSRRTAAKCRPDGQTCCGALAAHAGVRDAARGWRARISTYSWRRFRRDYYQRRRVRLDAEGIRPSFCSRDSRSTPRLAFQKKMRDVTEFLADWESPRNWRSAAARHLSGFLPSAARTERFAKPRASCCAPFPAWNWSR